MNFKICNFSLSIYLQCNNVMNEIVMQIIYPETDLFDFYAKQQNIKMK